MRGGLRVNDKRDCWLLNFWWLYGSGMITKKLFHQFIENNKYDFVKEKEYHNRN